MSAALLILGIMMMQRPRPSYMFPYTLFIMALSGLGLDAVLNRVRMSRAVEVCSPLAVILLIFLVPPHFDSDYTSPFGYKGQVLRKLYESVAPHVREADLRSAAAVVIPVGDYSGICNYLGITCRSLNGEDLSSEGMKGLFFDTPADSREGNVYILYIEDMIGKFTLGSRQGKGNSYWELNCSPLVKNSLKCGNVSIDLNSGVLNDGFMDVPLRAAVYVDEGYTRNRTDYGSDRGYYLQVLRSDNNVNKILMMNDVLFRTNFNQQFLLGNYDKRYFDEVYNDFPKARMLKLKRTETFVGNPNEQ
jgi:hypothetical protein